MNEVGLMEMARAIPEAWERFSPVLVNDHIVATWAFSNFPNISILGCSTKYNVKFWRHEWENFGNTVKFHITA